MRLWQKLWQIKVMGKVKTLLVMGIHQVVPCKAALARRKLISNPTYPACGKGAETLDHALLCCTTAKATWKA